LKDMGLLRSEVMKYGMLVLPVQDAKKYVDQIGRETNIQFEDMNSRDMRRPYRKHIQRIDEMERILRFMFEEISKLDGCEILNQRIDQFLAKDDIYKLDAVEAELQGLYQSFIKFKENNVSLTSDRNQAIEESEVVSAAMEILGASGSSRATVFEEGFEANATRPLIAGDEIARFGCIAGVVPKIDEMRFARACWRASRGNTFSVVRVLTENEKKIVDEAAKQLFARKPDYVAPGGNAYGQKQRAQCLRDYSWYLRLVTYGVLAGSTEMIQKIGLEGAREMYNSLGVPMPGMVEAMRTMKLAAISLLGTEDAAIAGPYFDFLIQGMQTST
jgi:allophycocyanin-B